MKDLLLHNLQVTEDLTARLQLELSVIKEGNPDIKNIERHIAALDKHKKEVYEKLHELFFDMPMPPENSMQLDVLKDVKNEDLLLELAKRMRNPAVHPELKMWDWFEFIGDHGRTYKVRMEDTTGWIY